MPDWAYQPLQEAQEDLEWRTDILTAREGEQRIARRPEPREIVTLRYRFDRAQYAEALARVRANPAASWTVSLWHRVAADGTVPTRAGWLRGGLALARERQGRAVAEAVWHLAPVGETGTSPYSAYAGLDLVADRTVVRAPLAASLAQAIEHVDSGFGPVTPEPVLDWVQERQMLSFVDHRQAARDARRSWLLTLRGRQKAFWLPTWGHELVLQEAAGASDTSLLVAASGPVAGHVGRHLMIDLPAGPIAREVTAAATDTGNHRLTIAAPGSAVPLGTQIHWLLRMRLDTDRVTLRHSSTRTEMTAPAVEVPA